MRSAAQKKIVLRIGLPVKPAADLTARLTDRQANGVADATVVSVTAEGGQIVLCCVVLCCVAHPHLFWEFPYSQLMLFASIHHLRVVGFQFWLTPTG